MEMGQKPNINLQTRCAKLERQNAGLINQNKDINKQNEKLEFEIKYLKDILSEVKDANNILKQNNELLSLKIQKLVAVEENQVKVKQGKKPGYSKTEDENLYNEDNRDITGSTAKNFNDREGHHQSQWDDDNSGKYEASQKVISNGYHGVECSDDDRTNTISKSRANSDLDGRSDNRRNAKNHYNENNSDDIRFDGEKPYNQTQSDYANGSVKVSSDSRTDHSLYHYRREINSDNAKDDAIPVVNTNEKNGYHQTQCEDDNRAQRCLRFNSNRRDVNRAKSQNAYSQDNLDDIWFDGDSGYNQVMSDNDNEKLNSDNQTDQSLYCYGRHIPSDNSTSKDKWDDNGSSNSYEKHFSRQDQWNYNNDTGRVTSTNQRQNQWHSGGGDEVHSNRRVEKKLGRFNGKKNNCRSRKNTEKNYNSTSERW